MKISNKKRLELLSPRAGKLRVVMDTDAYNEIDDQFAIAQMMLSPERLSVEAIYAAPFHNYRSKNPSDGMEQSYEEILRLLDRLKIDAEGLVYPGVDQYVGPKKKYKDVKILGWIKEVNVSPQMRLNNRVRFLNECDAVITSGISEKFKNIDMFKFLRQHVNKNFYLISNQGFNAA